jgi:hypothetical protein
MTFSELFKIVLAWENFKDWASAELHISHWTIHAAVGIPLLLIFGRLMRKPLASPAPLLPVAALELINELLDFLRDFVPGWVWNWSATSVEVTLTLVPPVVLILLARAREHRIVR